MRAVRLCRRGVVESAGAGGLTLAIDAPVPVAAEGADGRSVCCGQCPGVRGPARIDWSHLRQYASRAGAGPGDPVELSVAAIGLTRAAAWLFGIPLAGLVMGALAGDWLGGDSGGAAGLAGGFGMLGLVAGVLMVRRAAPRLIGMLEIRAEIAVDDPAAEQD